MSKRRRGSRRSSTPVRSRTTRRTGFQPKLDFEPVRPVKRREVRQVVAANRVGRPRFVLTRATRQALRRTGKLDLVQKLTRTSAQRAVRAAGLKNAPAEGKRSRIAVRAPESRSKALARRIGIDPKVLCQERRERRSTLFQIGVAGSGKKLSPGPYVNDVLSWVQCRRKR